MEENNLGSRPDAAQREPGAVLLFSAGQLHSRVFPLSKEPLQLGRGRLGDVELADNFMSRQHSQVAYDSGRFVITDCGSLNGTTVNGQPIRGTVDSSRSFLLRAGETLLLLSHDVRRFRQFRVRETEDLVLGPLTEPRLAALAGAQGAHFSGEPGSGRAFVARYFHAHASDPSGPFVSVACEGLTPSLAERALFGDEEAPGQVAAAHGGTLLLDGITAVPLDLQRRLARVIRGGRPEGGDQVSRPASFRLCSTSRLASGQLLEGNAVVPELLHGRVDVPLPPLRQRIEEIPYFIARALRALSPALPAHASLVEACMVRPWPGNVRELLMEVRNAAAAAVEADARDVRAAHLSVAAGMPLNVPDRFETLEESPEAIARSMRGAGASGSSGGRP